MNSDEERPVIVRKALGRPRKGVSNGRVGRPRLRDSIPYQARGLRAPKTKIVEPPTQVQTRLRAGAAPKEYKLSLRPRDSARQNDEDDDEVDNRRKAKAKGKGKAKDKGKGRPKAKQQSRRKSPRRKDEQSDSDEDSDPFDDSDDQPRRRLPRNRNRNRSSVERRPSGWSIDDDNMSIGNDGPGIQDDDMDTDQEDFGYNIPDGDDDDFPFIAETPAHRHREVVAETPAKRGLSDSPDLSAPRPKRQALAAYRPFDLEDIGESSSRGGQTKGEPSSLGEPRQDLDRTILQYPLRVLELGRLRIRGFYPSAEKSYLDEQTIRGSYWDRDTENEFNLLWRRDEHDSRFEQGPRGDSDELELWKMVLIRYRSILPDLFTYGLKLGEDCYEAPESIMLSSKASYMLQTICAHPIWARDLDMLRFVLQTAVKLSIRDHCEPLAPPLNLSDVEDLVLDNVTEDKKEMFFGMVQYRVWAGNKKGAGPELWSLYEELEKQFQPSPAKSKVEAILFILTIDVMSGVLRALEHLDPFIYTQRPAKYVEAFRDYHGVFLAGVEPQDNRQLIAVKWELELQALRDEEIRSVMEISQDYLYDVPHRSRKHDDIVPLYHHEPMLDEDTLSALTGTVKDPKRCTLSRLDRMNDHRARALGDFRDRLREAFSHDAVDAGDDDDLDMPAPLEAECPEEFSGADGPGEFSGADGPGEFSEADAPEDKASEQTQVPMDLSQFTEGLHIPVPFGGILSKDVLGDANALMNPIRPPYQENSWGAVVPLQRQVLLVSIENRRDLAQPNLKRIAFTRKIRDRLFVGEGIEEADMKFDSERARGDDL
ncbi:hypothetical protein FHL15_010361 [Xylaria flabelliformis]|uniref:Uncharacterized protein n=1 Tax=Xylaria flabelliformis TaxID=2512241 RepID=A0A553HLF5_9PEZI|nr:hypothetical protein FHL15_010361 [Xylaria flabelliformis]